MLFHSSGKFCATHKDPQSSVALGIVEKNEINKDRAHKKFRSTGRTRRHINAQAAPLIL